MSKKRSEKIEDIKMIERTWFYAFGLIVPDPMSICTTASPGRVATWAEQSTCFLAPGKVVWGAH